MNREAIRDALFPANVDVVAVGSFTYACMGMFFLLQVLCYAQTMAIALVGIVSSLTKFFFQFAHASETSMVGRNTGKKNVVGWICK